MCPVWIMKKYGTLENANTSSKYVRICLAKGRMPVASYHAVSAPRIETGFAVAASISGSGLFQGERCAPASTLAGLAGFAFLRCVSSPKPNSSG
jgi:hypothetical protein